MASLVPKDELKSWLDQWAAKYEQPNFIPLDPISIPHRYSRHEDIECAAFVTATIAWGRRAAILKSADHMLTELGDSPVAFLVDASAEDLTEIHWAHRTFLPEDGHRFLHSLQLWYREHSTMEGAFLPRANEPDLHLAIDRFRQSFASFWLDTRSSKHLASPSQGSAAKRLHLFLRWMVRSSDKGVDFGLWHNIDPKQLSCPLDVHSVNVARSLGLLTRGANDQRAVRDLDLALREFDSLDPVKYDFALFGMGEAGILSKNEVGSPLRISVSSRG